MKILLVEDDRLLSAALTKILTANRYIIDLADNGKLGLELATTLNYDLILLDVQLPGLDGISLCRTLRTQGYRQPILLLTTDDSDATAIAGFDAGADEYITKPCTPKVLLARIRTLLRRRGTPDSELNLSPNSPQTLTWGKLCLDPDAGRVTYEQNPITLTATEYQLLELFLRNPDRIFSRSAILDRLWSFAEAPSDRAIVTHIKDLRKKLKAGGLTTEIIETVYGMGYRLKPPVTESSHPSTKIEQLLDKFQAVFAQQVTILATAQTALLAGTLTPELQQAARQEAHKLAGSLAAFGYPNGSQLARSLEHLLMSDSLSTPAACSQFSQTVTALQQELAQPRVPSTPTVIAKGKGDRVLVIDDDTALTERLTLESDHWGFRLKIAPTPNQARSCLKICSPDVIVLDLSFPDTEEDGLALLQELTTQSPQTPVIVLTGRDSLSDRLAVSRSGAKQFLQKTATPTQIFQTLRRVLTQPQASQAKLLIVDDDPAILATLSTILTPWGLAITTLSEPENFWQVLVTTAPSLVLLDLEMPQVSGLELCQVVRQDAQWGDLPILVVTAHTDVDSLQQAFAAGADDFITKPVLGPELITRVLSRIERRRWPQTVGNSEISASQRSGEST